MTVLRKTGPKPLTLARPKPKAEGWVKDLESDRLEIFLKSPQHRLKLRCSGSTETMHELVDWFEEQTGLAVDVPNRVRRGPKPMEGQLDLLDTGTPFPDVVGRD